MSTEGDGDGQESRLTVSLERIEGFQFRVTLGEGFEELLMDEPEPLGEDRGPNASRVLSAAVGNCLSASLLFCLRKADVDPETVMTDVTTTLTRNEDGRLRIGSTDVEILLDLAGEDRDRIGRCLQVFEDYCVVTQSVREGIDVDVSVLDAEGEELGQSAEGDGA